MDNYITAYRDELEYLISKELNLNEDSFIKELYDKFYDIFPCDNESNLLEVAVLLYFHNEGMVNKAHKYLFSKHIFKDLPYKAVKFIIHSAGKKIQKKIDQIKRFSLTPLQSCEIKKLTKSAEKCKVEFEKIEKFIQTNESFFEKKFKGEFQISKPISGLSRSRRQSIRDKLPKNITNKEKLEIISHYDSFIDELNRYYEVWEQIIYEEYPNTVCIGNDAYLITTDKYAEKLTELDSKRKSKILLEKRKKYSMGPYQNLSIPIHEIENCNLPIFVCTLGINYDNSFTGHSNGLVFLLDEKQIYRLEPNGKDEFNDHVIKNELSLYTQFNEYEYHGTIKTCPYSPIGIQTIEALFNTVKIPKKQGYCFIWSLILLYYVIEYESELSPDQIQNYLIHYVDLNDLMYRFIIKLIKRYDQMIDENYSFKNTETSRLIKVDPSILFNVYLTDMSTEDNIQTLYYLISRDTHFDAVVRAFFDLSKVTLLDKENLNNIKKMLEVLENGTLYNKLKEMDKENLIADEFLPRTIYYYKDIVKQSFEEYIKRTIDIGSRNALKKLYFLFFELKYCFQ